MKCSSNIYFLRHIETENNLKGIVTGKSDSPVIVTEPMSVIDLTIYDRIYCSPLKRCIETIKQKALNKKELYKIILDDRLIERNMGLLEGVQKLKLIDKSPQMFVGNLFDVFRTPPDGESYEIFYKRIYDFYLQILCSVNDSILICSHNQALKMLFLVINNFDVTYENWSRYSFPYGKVIKVSDVI